MEFKNLKVCSGPISLTEDTKITSYSSKFLSDWGKLKHGVPQGSIPEPLLFIIYINNLPLRINSVSEQISFTDDTSVTISSRNFEDFCSVSNLVLSDMIKWFAAYKLVLNLDKMK